jgi:hypothetical protein
MESSSLLTGKAVPQRNVARKIFRSTRTGKDFKGSTSLVDRRT